jgi:hypothetical protein
MEADDYFVKLFPTLLCLLFSVTAHPHLLSCIPFLRFIMHRQLHLPIYPIGLMYCSVIEEPMRNSWFACGSIRRDEDDSKATTMQRSG